MQLGIPDNYVASDGEINNLVYLTLKYTVGWQMRQADLAIMKMMQGGEVVGTSGIEKLVRDTCEYAWDHIAGEPDEVTPDQLFDHMVAALEAWYKDTTPEERANTN